MIEPISALAAAAAYAVVRCSLARSERTLLQARAELVCAAAGLPPGTRIDTLSRDGSRWTVLVPATPAIASEEADDAR